MQHNKRPSRGVGNSGEEALLVLGGGVLVRNPGWGDGQDQVLKATSAEGRRGSGKRIVETEVVFRGNRGVRGHLVARE